ncbi:MAG: hypothetical protein H5U30_13720 [Marinobacter sp.]|nr:hypothetical protein [Marinobacter sp.]
MAPRQAQLQPSAPAQQRLSNRLGLRFGGRRFALALFRRCCRPFGNIRLALGDRFRPRCPASVTGNIQDKHKHKKGQEAD